MFNSNDRVILSNIARYCRNAVEASEPPRSQELWKLRADTLERLLADDEAVRASEPGSVLSHQADQYCQQRYDQLSGEVKRFLSVSGREGLDFIRMQWRMQFFYKKCLELLGGKPT